MIFVELAFRSFLAIALLVAGGCSAPEAQRTATDAAPEALAEPSTREIASLSGAIQVYLVDWDDEHLTLSWNIADGYRLYIDVTTISEVDGPLPCAWTGLIESAVVRPYGVTRTARTLATAKCKRRVAGPPAGATHIVSAGGLADGTILPPVKHHTSRDERWPRFYSGLAIQDLSRELMAIDPALAHGGALVSFTVPGGPADRAGLARGDIVTAVSGIPVRSSVQLVSQLQSNEHRGPALRLGVVRHENSSFRRLAVILVRDPASPPDASGGDEPNWWRGRRVPGPRRRATDGA